MKSPSLGKAGYKVSEQVFEFPFFEEVAAGHLRAGVADAENYESPHWSTPASGDVTGELVPTNDIVIPPTPAPSSTSGCRAADFAPATGRTQVALVQRGTCTFARQGEQRRRGRVCRGGHLQRGPARPRRAARRDPRRPRRTIPVVGIGFADGVSALRRHAGRPGAACTSTTATFSETRTTKNVIADSRKGNPNKVVVVGAHLDSVLEGPGINDNGSGTATNPGDRHPDRKAEDQPRQKLRFAFWGAEESGLLGSTHYVANLSRRRPATRSTRT